MGLALGTGELFHRATPTRLPWQSCFCLDQLWAEPGGCCWGCSYFGLPPLLQAFKLFVLQELFALQIPSLCPWGGTGTAAGPIHGSVAEQDCAVQPGSRYILQAAPVSDSLGPLQGSLSAHCRPCLVSPPWGQLYNHANSLLPTSTCI